MSESAVRQTEHQIVVSAPPPEVFRLLVDVGNWPTIFPPTIHVEHLEHGDTEERIRIWATANGKAHGWTSRRELDRDGLRIRFHQEASAHPVAAMGGEWIVEALAGGRSRVRLRHRFRAVDGTPETIAWIHRAVDRNSETELAALRAAAERGEGDQRLITVNDTVQVDGAAADVYRFLYQAKEWAQRLPHVDRVSVDEKIPHLQVLEMDTRAADGSTHTTVSVRVCFPEHRIVYKQLRLPALMSVHTGQWTIRNDGDVTVATSRHTVAIAPEAVAGVLGELATVEDAREFVRCALSRNSLMTLNAAKTYAERHPGQVTERAPSRAKTAPLA
ncbi:MAG: aromatase/cyclase [Pseudonocardiaceae bacterium]